MVLAGHHFKVQMSPVPLERDAALEMFDGTDTVFLRKASGALLEYTL